MEGSSQAERPVQGRQYLTKGTTVLSKGEQGEIVKDWLTPCFWKIFFLPTFHMPAHSALSLSLEVVGPPPIRKSLPAQFRMLPLSALQCVWSGALPVWYLPNFYGINSHHSMNSLSSFSLCSVCFSDTLFSAHCLTPEGSWRSPQSKSWGTQESYFAHFSAVGKCRMIQARLYVCPMWVMKILSQI